MPTPIPAPEKSAVLAIVKTIDPIEADKLTTILVNYEDVVTMVGRQLPEFEYYNSYLKQVLGALDNNQLQAVGVYRGVVGAVGNDAILIFDCTVTGGINITATHKGIGIFGNSTVDLITVAAGINLTSLYIAPGSKVKMLDSTAVGAFVNNIFLRFQRSAAAELTAIKVGSNLNKNGIEVEPGAIFGGITDNDPTLACAEAVTNLAATDVTWNTIKLGWTAPPGNYVQLNTFYKKSESPIWLIGSEETGDFITDGYIFRKLQPDTKYDFKVEVMCLNGGIAQTTLSEVTTCCQ